MAKPGATRFALNRARKRVRKIAEGRTINGTYQMMPGEALVAFRADLLLILGEE